MAIYTLRSGATAHPEDSVLQPITDLISAAGVRDMTATNHLKVVQRAAGANMSVDIGTGRAFIKGSGNAYPIRNTTAINAVIGNNTSGNPRKDAVVLYIDLAESPTTTADDVVKTAVVPGTPSGSPSSPSDSDIQTAVGGSNPFLRLADVTVAHNETSIENADITDTRVAFQLISGIGGIMLAQAGVIAVANNVTSQVIAPKAGTHTSLFARVKTAPTGAALTGGVNKNGVEVATFSISAGNLFTSSTGLNITYVAGDYFTLDIDTVGSSVAGSDLTVVLG